VLPAISFGGTLPGCRAYDPRGMPPAACHAVPCCTVVDRERGLIGRPLNFYSSIYCVSDIPLRGSPRCFSCGSAPQSCAVHLGQRGRLPAAHPPCAAPLGARVAACAGGAAPPAVQAVRSQVVQCTAVKLQAVRAAGTPCMHLPETTRAVGVVPWKSASTGL